MQAVILAGGKGIRLRPYTTVLPKPLMPIGDYPILEVVIRQLKKFGFNRIILSVGHQHELFMAFFGNGEKWGIKINYFIEDEPLGTAAPIKYIQNLDDNFLLMNGDILTDLNYNELMEYHKNKGGVITIATHNRVQKIDYGVLEYNMNNILTAYKEKPQFNYSVSMGIYILSKKTVDLIPERVYFDFPSLVLEALQNEKKVICFPYDGYWMDIGRIDDYENAIDDFEKMKGKLL